MNVSVAQPDAAAVAELVAMCGTQGATGIGGTLVNATEWAVRHDEGEGPSVYGCRVVRDAKGAPLGVAAITQWTGGAITEGGIVFWNYLAATSLNPGGVLGNNTRGPGLDYFIANATDATAEPRPADPAMLRGATLNVTYVYERVLWATFACGGGAASADGVPLGPTPPLGQLCASDSAAK